MFEKEKWYTPGLESDEEEIQVIKESGEHVAMVACYPTTKYARLIKNAPGLFRALKELTSLNILNRNVSKHDVLMILQRNRVVEIINEIERAK